MADTRDRWRKRLPHWEVLDRPHFVTIRCAGSLPLEAQQRLGEIHRSLHAVTARSADFAQLQRHYFLASEKYLDTGTGFAPFTDPKLCTLCRTELLALESEWGWATPHWVLMPNHVHLLLHAGAPTATPLRHAIPALKGRFARNANRLLGRTGPFWQKEWFDHWVRDEAERLRIIDYIRQNPVKAGLAESWERYSWVQ